MNMIKIADMLMGVLSKRGGTVIDDTEDHTGTWSKVMITAANTKFATYIATGFTGTITEILFAQGTVLYGDITAITLSQGKVVAYNR